MSVPHTLSKLIICGVSFNISATAELLLFT